MIGHLLQPRVCTLAFLALALAANVGAQEPLDSDKIIARVRAGGRFEETKWRRGEHGQLELHYFADTGRRLGDKLRFKPLLGESLERGLMHAGVFGFAAMVCHGPSDLLGMTDAEFHLKALGVDTTDVGLRQYLALSPSSFEESGRGRAECFDRMVAIDLLVGRASKGAIGELQAIAKGDAPAQLRERARCGISQLSGQGDGIARRRLSPETMKLPLVFDACIMIDHARLPRLDWLTPMSRRFGMLVTAAKVEASGGRLTPAKCNGAQTMSDLAGELPFGVALQYGNARFDHSCVVVTMKNDPQLPFALSWQAAGQFASEGWQNAVVPERAVRNNPLLGGTLSATDEGMQVTVGGGAGKPRPAKAEPLLRDNGSAIRVIVPKTSKLWAAAQAMRLPAATNAELQVTFADPGVLTVRIDARDEEAAEAWVAVGKDALANSKQMLGRMLPLDLRNDPDIARLLKQWSAAKIASEGATVTAGVELSGVTPAIIRKIVWALTGPRF